MSTMRGTKKVPRIAPLPSCSPTKIRAAGQSRLCYPETNVFLWPGPDIRPVSTHGPATIAFGLLSANFFRAVRERLLANQNSGLIRQVRRTE
jgi:hypothetical protein